jgi:hypothetical protein
MAAPIITMAREALHTHLPVENLSPLVLGTPQVALEEARSRMGA